MKLDPVVASVVGITVLAAVLRLRGLGTESFWLDESFTIEEAKLSFWGMLKLVRHQETTPPLYFSLVWGWTRVFGYSEVAIRSLSVIAGVATVPVVYTAARTLLGRLPGLAAATLVALTPFFIYQSQEARAYPLLVFFCACALLFLARALRDERSPDLIGWTIAAVGALTTHYFAVFVLVPMSVSLLARPSLRRRALKAIGVVCVIGLALIPLVAKQTEETGGWVGSTPLGDRLGFAAKVFTTGSYFPSSAVVVLVACAGLLAIALAVWRGDRDLRRGTVFVLILAAVSILVPITGSFVGVDYVLDRYLPVSWLLLTVAASAAVGTRRLSVVGAALLLIVCAVFLRPDLSRPESAKHDDWRRVAHFLSPPKPGRVVVIAPSFQIDPIRLYMRDLESMRTARRAAEIAIIVYWGPTASRDPRKVPKPPPGFRLLWTKFYRSGGVQLYRAPKPQLIQPLPLTTAFRTTGRNGSEVYFERGRTPASGD